jgi:hypothetical protein
VPGEVSALREILTEEPVGVLVRASLPWAAWIAEVDLEAGVDAQLGVLGHLCSLIPGQGPAELVGQFGDDLSDRVSHGFGAVTGERWAVLHRWFGAVAFHAWQVQQHREPCGALDEGSDRRVVQPDDEIAFPVTRHGPVISLGGSFADHHLRGDELLASGAGACSRDAQCPAGAQTRDQFTFERASALDVERLVDGLVGDPHLFIIGELDA